MPKLYYTLRRGLKLALELYFVDIQSSGTEHVPAHGPVIFAANHPNSIMDTMLLGACTSRQVHYMARSGLFKNPVVAWVFNACGVIPVYRAQDGTDMSQNRSSFDRAYQTLQEGLCIGIFPEGKNSEERRVQRLKTGAARIALGAEAQSDFRLGVKIIPVGITFQDRDRFLTSVLLRFGEPIEAASFRRDYERDEREAARALTHAIQDALEDQVLHIEHDLVREMSEAIVQMSGGELLSTIKREAPTGARLALRERFKRARGVRKRLLDRFRSVKRAPKLTESFALQRALSDALSEELLDEPQRFAKRRAEIRRYKDHLRQTSLRDDFAVRHPVTLSSRKEALKLTTYALLVGPLAAWGFVHNVLPYQAVYALAIRASDEAIRALTAFASGLVIFSLWYTLLGVSFWHVVGHHSELLTALYLISVAFCGFVFLRYRQRVATWRKLILARTLFRTRTALVEGLVEQREAILSQVYALLVAHFERRSEPLPEELLAAAAPEPIEPIAPSPR